jgi:hypothetical protein
MHEIPVEDQSLKNEQNNPESLFVQAKKELVDYLKSQNPDLVLCLGDSVSEIAEYLKTNNIPLIHLDHDKGIQLYERGDLEDQSKKIEELSKQSKKIIVVEDTILSGGKIWQLKMAFDYANIPFQAVILAANSDQKEDYLKIISTNFSLVSFMQKKTASFMDSRKSQFIDNSTCEQN